MKEVNKRENSGISSCKAEQLTRWTNCVEQFKLTIIMKEKRLLLIVYVLLVLTRSTTLRIQYITRAIASLLVIS